jgi:serine/threonine-protein kinase
VVIGNYRLLEEIGRGGMGSVYRAEHVLLKKPVAIKVLHARYTDHPEACQRFLNEARAAAELRHPNIVDVTDFGRVEDGGFYFVMELIEGQSLDQSLGTGPMQLFRTLGIAGQVARALGAVHRRGIVHRDLKPGNILVRRETGHREIVRVVGQGEDRAMLVETEGEYDLVKLVDFGVAKFREVAEDPDRVLGTPHYMAPEQIRGEDIDHRVDIYALGVVLFEMIVGAPPFDGETPEDTVRMHVESPPPLPRLFRPDLRIPEAVECVILKALAKNRSQRHADMDEFWDDLQTCFQGTFYRRDASAIGLVPARVKTPAAVRHTIAGFARRS